MTTLAAKTIEMKPENLAEIQKMEADIFYELNEFVTDDTMIEDLADIICTLLSASGEQIFEKNTSRAHSLALVISFMMKQRISIENLNFFRRNSHE